jgi:hypothetical protein
MWSSARSGWGPKDALIKSEFINRKVEKVEKGKKKQCFDLKNLFDFAVKFLRFRVNQRFPNGSDLA